MSATFAALCLTREARQLIIDSSIRVFAKCQSVLESGEILHLHCSHDDRPRFRYPNARFIEYKRFCGTVRAQKLVILGNDHLSLHQAQADVNTALKNRAIIRHRILDERTRSVLHFKLLCEFFFFFFYLDKSNEIEM